MDCSEAKPFLSALASGRTSVDDETELREHLQTCVECALETELLRRRGTPPAPAPALEPSPAPEPALEPAPVLEPAPAVRSPAPPPQSSDWTVEKIFGTGGAASAAPPSHPDSAADPLVAESLAAESLAAVSADEESPVAESLAAESAAESFAAETSAPPSQVFATEEAPEAEDAPASPSANATAGAWDFEPADAAREVTPPEESLLFAEQALKRSLGDPNRKRAATRAILWGGSAVVGLALLAVSLWMLMVMREEPPREIAAREKSPVATPEPADSSAGSESNTPATDPAVDAATTSPDPATPPPSDGVTPGPIKSSLVPNSAPPSSKVPAPATKGGDRSSQPAPPKAAAKELRPAEKSGGPAAGTSTGVKHDDDDMWPTDDPVRPAPTAPRTSATPKGAGVSAPATPSHTIAPPPSTAATPVAGQPAPAETATSVPSDATSADLKPLDRLHAETAQAAKDEDLEELRRLKTTWKNLLRTVVGPDRARAKREFAECLWDIQALSGRKDDQRQTLVAYRDYLLSAPAGGADARSASRLRELEDALSERR